MDTIVILTCIVLAGLPAIFGASYGSKAFPILWPIQQIAWTASIYFTMLMTLERYLAVFYKKSASVRNTIASMVCVLIFAILYNITRFLEYTTVFIPELNTTNAQENENYGLLSNGAYVVGYLICCNLIFRLILPFCIFTFCNARLIRMVRKISHIILYETLVGINIINVSGCCPSFQYC